MNRAVAILVLCSAFVGIGCSKSDSASVVFVSVTAPPGLAPVTQLRVSLAYASRTDTELFPQTNSTTPISFVPAATFVLDLPHSSSGSIDIAIDAINSVGRLISHGEKVATIVTGGRTDVAVAFPGNDGADGGLGTDANGYIGAGGSVGTGGIVGNGGSVGFGGVVGTGGTLITARDAAIAQDANFEADGMGSTGGISGTGGVVGAGGVGETTNDGGYAGIPDAADAQQDVPVVGTGGSVDGPTGSGGTTGTTGTGGTTNTGGTTASGGNDGGPPSCAGLTSKCGPSNESCCESLLVPGGTYYRSYDGVDNTDKNYPATVAGFYLDKYEITVGRFRQFVNAGMGTQSKPPSAGAGAHPLIAGSGWDSTWNTTLAATTASLETTVKCGTGYQNWTDTAGSNESRPMNCIDWYTAFAFCAWDGGRLATEAEWNYAASGGSEQRYYPWSSPATSTTIDDSLAVYCGGSCSGTQNVGSKSPKGDGKWGQSDLAGNVFEWVLDWENTYQMPCTNCAEIADLSASGRVIQGGGFYDGVSYLRSAGRYGSGDPGRHDYGFGARCARTGP
jgi:sulfatase modifying factor 1